MPNLFNIEHTAKASYSIAWNVERNAEANELFKLHNVRPSEIREHKAGECRLLPGACFSALITSAARRKIWG